MKRDLNQFTNRQLEQICAPMVPGSDARHLYGDSGLPPQSEWTPEFWEIMVERQQAALLLQERYRNSLDRQNESI